LASRGEPRETVSFCVFIRANRGAGLGAEPADIVAQAIFDVSGRETATASDWCQVLKVSNLVAWRLWTNHAAPAPYGLLHKEGGTRAVLRPDGSCTDGQHTNEPNGFALDYVIDRSTGFGRDIVTSWGAAQWPEPETAADMVARNFRDFREPFDPATYLDGPIAAAVVVPPPVVPPVSVPPPVFDVAALAAQLAQLQLALERTRTGSARPSRSSIRTSPTAATRTGAPGARSPTTGSRS
jgi:hypothetical protein